MSIYGPLTAERFLDLLRTLGDDFDAEEVLARLLDAMIVAVEAERGYLVEAVSGPESYRVLGARHLDGVGLRRPEEKLAHFVLEKAIQDREPLYAAETGRDRRYRSPDGQKARSLLVVPVEVLAGRAGEANAEEEGRTIGEGEADFRQLAVYFDHRFQAIRYDEHSRRLLEHWLAVLRVAERLAGGRTAERPLPVPEAGAATAGEFELPGAEPRSYHQLLSASPHIHELFELSERVGRSDLPILVRGESGTGKELFARAIHAASPRAEAPFVVVHCAAIPEGLFEVEIFGHVRGAFSGAEEDRAGLMEEAHGGTLLLDEVGELPAALQGKFLRVLETGAFRPVGATFERQADVRILSSTHRDLEIAEGFRDDLLFRLSGMEFWIPPLRDRREDVALLLEHFLERLAAEAKRPVPKLSPPVLDRLLAYSWPGNVRELENEARRFVALGVEEVGREHLSRRIGAGLALPPIPTSAGALARGTRKLSEAVAEAERAEIEKALRLAGGVRSKAARLLGITRKALYRRLRRYGFN